MRARSVSQASSSPSDAGPPLVGSTHQMGLKPVSRMPSGPKMRCCAKTSSGWPLRRSMMRPSRMGPKSLYRVFEPGSYSSGSVAMRSRYARLPRT